MELKSISEKETPLLSRKRVEFLASYKGSTPSRKQLISEVSKKLNIKEENMIIRHIYTKYCLQMSKIIVHIYKDRKTLETIEDKYIVKKHTIETKEKKDDENKAETKQEKPKENKVDKVEKVEEKKETKEKPEETETKEEKKEKKEEKKPDVEK